MANRMHFWELLNGNPNGRRIAYTDVDEVTVDNIVRVLGDCIGVHNSNKAFIKYLWDYHNGDQPVRYRTKTVRDDVCNIVVENHAWEIVRFKNGQSNGEPRQLVATEKEEQVSKDVELFNKYTRAAAKQKADVSVGEWVSTVGLGYEAVILKHGKKIPVGYIALNPLTTFIIYSSKTYEPMLSVEELKDSDGYRYFQCYSDTTKFTVKDSKVTDARLHIYGGIPIVEKCNNQSRVSDVELVIDMLDAINDLQSNRVDSVAQFVQSWLKFVNCDIDEETFKKMKMLGALVVKSNNGSDNKADVDVISQELNQTQTQTFKDDLWDNVLSIEAIPTKGDGGGGGDRAGAVELRNGWDFSKQAARIKDVYEADAEMRLAEITLNILHSEIGNDICNITPLDYEIQIPHSPTDNMQVKAQVFQMLVNSGIHPLVAIKTCGLWVDAENTYEMSKPYLDVLHKTIDMVVEDAKAQEEKAKQLVEEYNDGNRRAEQPNA